jgi:hypothetical protein
MGAASRPAARIVLGLECGRAEEAALEAALALAAAMGSELAALFVEDERLMRLAALPFGQEIGRTSALLRTFGREQIEHAFDAEAGRLRRMLAGAAEPLALKWTLDVARGDLMAVSLERLGPDDLLVVGRGWRTEFARGRPAGGQSPFRRLAMRPVAVLLTDAEQAWRALDAAFAIARRTAGELKVLIHAAGQREFRAERERARERLAGAPARYLHLPEIEPRAIAEVVRSQGAAALVWPGLAPRYRAALAELLEELACPVVLLR